jgi:hypothetical protein
MFQSLPAENVALGTTIEQSCIKLNHDNLRTISGNPGETPRVVPAARRRFPLRIPLVGAADSTLPCLGLNLA